MLITSIGDCRTAGGKKQAVIYSSCAPVNGHSLGALGKHMFQRYFTLTDEPWTTAAVCLLFASAALMPLVVPHRLTSALGPTWMWMCVPFFLVFGEILALMRLKAPDTLRSILIVSLMAATFFLI
jgi:hypothetical protein